MWRARHGPEIPTGNSVSSGPEKRVGDASAANGWPIMTPHDEVPQRSLDWSFSAQRPNKRFRSGGVRSRRRLQAGPKWGQLVAAGGVPPANVRRRAASPELCNPINQSRRKRRAMLLYIRHLGERLNLYTIKGPRPRPAQLDDRQLWRLRRGLNDN